MPTLKGLHVCEMYRILHCQGCQYLAPVSSMGYCKYMLETGIRRPNPPMIEKCAVKAVDVSQADIDEVARETVERYNDFYNRRTKENELPFWDVKTAEKMFREGYTFSQIAEVVGVTRQRIGKYAKKHSWIREAF